MKVIREVFWVEEGKTFHADFGSSRTVQATVESSLARWEVILQAGDLKVAYRYGKGVIPIESEFRIWSNYDSSKPPPFPYKLSLQFANLELELRLGASHTVCRPGSSPLLSGAPAWKDTDLKRGVKWVTRVIEEDLPWPEAGIAAGLCIWADLIYRDMAERQYSRRRFDSDGSPNLGL